MITLRNAPQGTKVNLNSCSFEMAVSHVRQEVFDLAARLDIQSDVLVTALADVLGTAAAVLDRRVGEINIKDRLDAFCERVEHTYERMRNNAETASN